MRKLSKWREKEMRRNDQGFEVNRNHILTG
jgi:hypothetical protein